MAERNVSDWFGVVTDKAHRSAGSVSVSSCSTVAVVVTPQVEGADNNHSLVHRPVHSPVDGPINKSHKTRNDQDQMKRR